MTKSKPVPLFGPKHPSHQTAYSDSSVYDEKCTHCGATDAEGDTSLKRKCPKKNNVDMTGLVAGKRVRFRNGGISRVRYVKQGKSDFFPIELQLVNFHAGDEVWSYDNNGHCGQATGNDGSMCPFDIMEVLK